MHHRAFRVTTAALASILAICAAAAASAHAHVVNSDPPANATVAAPRTITLTFDEKLTPAFSGFELGMADGMRVNVKISLSRDGRNLIGTPDGKLMAGAYTITWHAVSAEDGHRTDGKVEFTVK